MSEYIIWHNPRCSKSRGALALLEERGIEPTIVNYLEHPPNAIELTRVLKALGFSPRDLMRTKEPVYAQLRLAEEDQDEKLIQAMVDHPELIERPVIIVGNRAVVGRPPEAVLSLLE